ncbi:hypothetical protein MJG53_008629 [Ovis ammon polii x Ovis aries]|uniref:Uncharacterized protein n=1 Tax=Ovis ammon polii x Ovis aries TaxID=2918886 RepID=A0ACB9V1S1_9CETA|nr:hypothetical protein MJG53_008629 [Ovis ammon polii x Ovis aries]
MLCNQRGPHAATRQQLPLAATREKPVRQQRARTAKKKHFLESESLQAKIDSHKTFDSLELSVNVEECAQRNDKTNRTGKTSRKGMVWIFLKQKLRKEYGFRKPQSGHQQVWRAVPSRLLPRCRLSSSSVYECISEDSPTSPNRHPVPASSAYEQQLLKPEHPEPELLNKRSHHKGKPMLCNEEELPPIPSRESLKTSNEDAAAAEKKLQVITNKRQVQTATSREEKLPPS